MIITRPTDPQPPTQSNTTKVELDRMLSLNMSLSLILLLTWLSQQIPCSLDEPLCCKIVSAWQEENICGKPPSRLYSRPSPCRRSSRSGLAGRARSIRSLCFYFMLAPRSKLKWKLKKKHKIYENKNLLSASLKGQCKENFVWTWRIWAEYLFANLISRGWRLTSIKR